MNLKKVIFLGLFLSVFLAAPFLYAEQEGDGPSDKSDFLHKRHEMMEKKIQEIYSQLNLTEEQKKQLEQNKAAHRDNKKSMFEQMRSYKKALNQELMKADFDMNRVTEIQSQLKALQSEMADERLNSILEVRKILTLEKFTKFLEFTQKNRFWSSEKKGKGKR